MLQLRWLGGGGVRIVTQLGVEGGGEGGDMHLPAGGGGGGGGIQVHGLRKVW